MASDGLGRWHPPHQIYTQNYCVGFSVLMSPPNAWISNGGMHILLLLEQKWASIQQTAVTRVQHTSWGGVRGFQEKGSVGLQETINNMIAVPPASHVALKYKFKAIKSSNEMDST